MKTTKGQRLNMYLKSRGITQSDLSGRLKYKSRAAISNWIRDEQDIPDLVIVEILKIYPEINADWFINDRGPMVAGSIEIASEPTPPYQNKECTNPMCKITIEYLNEKIDDLNDKIRLLEDNLLDFRRKAGSSPGEREGGVETAKTG